jgi:hypothetical protein
VILIERHLFGTAFLFCRFPAVTCTSRVASYPVECRQAEGLSLLQRSKSDSKKSVMMNV